MEFPLSGKSNDLKIIHQKHNEINRVKWDHCIEADPTGLPYANAEMLDILCYKQWNALIANDYEWVMPLPFNHKFVLFPQVFQPVFFQQNGIFGAGEKDLILTTVFLKSIPAVYRRVACNLKSDNMAPAFLKAVIRPNYILSIKPDMDELRSGYHRSLRRRVRIAKEGPMSVLADDDPSFQVEDLFRLIASFFIPLSDVLMKMGTDKVIDILKKILESGKARAFLVKDSSDKSLAGCICLVSDVRASLIVTATSEAGRKLDSTHLMLDHVIETMLRTGRSCFDFEGSSIKGVAEFYQQFGATKEEYYTVRRIFGKWKN